MQVTNLYYTKVFQRTNAVKMAFLHFFLAISSWPRVFIEVFTRKHFGERYFLYPLTWFLAILLAYIPRQWSEGQTLGQMIRENYTWYAFIIALIVASYKRHREIKREPGVYDFKKFSLSAGIINDFFYELEVYGIKVSNRLIATVLEPGIFMLLGIALVLMNQRLGALFIGSSIIYSLSWSAQYHVGDQFVMDMIDKMIANEELTNSFVHNRLPGQTRGFDADSGKIKNKDFRRKVAENMFEEEPPADVI